MAHTVDARGLSCPRPVIKTKAALDAVSTGQIVVLVDEEAAKENICRLAWTLGCTVEVVQEAGEYKLTIDKGMDGER